MNKQHVAAFVVSISFAIGCAGQPADPMSTPSTYSVTLPPATAQQILDVVNYPGTDLAALDGAAGLDSRAAKNIITKRNGADGLSPSGDDFVFSTIAQLDAVTDVGDAAFAKLATYAAAHPAPVGETVEGVTFAGWQSESIVWGVNQAEAAELFGLLDDRAARSLELGRPYASVTAMGSARYVAATALNKLLAAAPGWWTKKHGAVNDAGRFDGAVFSESEAETALQIVNQATLPQFTAHGITTAPANKIIASRPYTSLATVAGLSGVGSATMNALLKYAQSGTWGASCVSNFAAAVGPLVAGPLEFLSESDRPLNVVSYPGAGTAAPTAASLAALVGADPASILYTRGVDDFYNDLESDDVAAAAVKAAFAAQLSDVVYIAIQPPASSIDSSLVDVYLVGRTSCGDLVGIHAISVET